MQVLGLWHCPGTTLPPRLKKLCPPIHQLQCILCLGHVCVGFMKPGDLDVRPFHHQTVPQVTLDMHHLCTKFELSTISVAPRLLAQNASLHHSFHAQYASCMNMQQLMWLTAFASGQPSPACLLWLLRPVTQSAYFSCLHSACAASPMHKPTAYFCTPS